MNQFNNECDPPNTKHKRQASENALLCDDIGIGKPDAMSDRFNSVLMHNKDGVAFRHDIESTGDIKQDFFVLMRAAGEIVMGIEK